ncbi:MAG TPA: aspartate carbamoyltransferase catalytic subunit [Thermoanaerobaculia bacterium]|nr:aspartate carbamoyltransferase catalytic subunit [Thermoanaerobaculia bacterium]HLN92838.1 aspartate carbamoyltransferase catalytic subunit [Thermoanaerobaculia bacterium]
MNRPIAALRSKDLLGIEPLEADEIVLLLDTADSMRTIAERPIKKVPALRGRMVVNLFFEASTRTRFSFETAEKWLSADSLNFSGGKGTSVEKGETLLDTARTLQAMSPDLVVVRHSSAGVPHLLARHLEAGVINAGDGAHEHPTQALLDALTIRQRLGRLRGLRVVIAGDIAYSRVARSNVFLLTKMGADVVLCGPPTLLPPHLEDLGVAVTTDLDRAIEGANVVMVLRMQLERQRRSLFPSTREYFARYGLTAERLSRAHEDAIVMHPGPMNRGVEIASDVADSARSVILDQVANGVAVRMAVLYLLLARRPWEGM